MQAIPLPPDRAAFDADLRKPLFRGGEFAGLWRLSSLAWPHAIVAVAAAPRAGSPAEFAFRFELTGYPVAAPTAQPWDVATGCPLPAIRWPRGTGVFASVFRPEWRMGTCLYLPCDRLSMEGHPTWQHQHPDRVWNPRRGIVHYLEQVHALLDEDGYSGAICA